MGIFAPRIMHFLIKQVNYPASWAYVLEEINGNTL